MNCQVRTTLRMSGSSAVFGSGGYGSASLTMRSAAASSSGMPLDWTMSARSTDAVAADADVDHDGPAECRAARLVGIVEVADALDAVDPGAQVGGPRVFAGAGGDELARRPLGVALRAQVDLGGQPRHLHVVLDLQPARRQRPWHRPAAWSAAAARRVAARAADHARFRRRLRRGRLRAQLARRRRRLRACGTRPLWVSRGRLALVVLAAALVAGLGEEIGLLRRQRGRRLGQDHVQRRQHRRGVLEREAHAEHQHAVQQQRQHHGRAQAFGFADLRTRCGNGGHQGAARLRGCWRRGFDARRTAWPAMLSPNCASSSRMQVGLVTLTSVR